MLKLIWSILTAPYRQWQAESMTGRGTKATTPRLTGKEAPMPSTEQAKTCGTCGWFELYDQRPWPVRPGHCIYPLPKWVNVKNGIRPDIYENEPIHYKSRDGFTACPCWKPKEEPNATDAV